MGVAFLCWREPIPTAALPRKNAHFFNYIMFFRKCGINRRRRAPKRARPVEKMAT